MIQPVKTFGLIIIVKALTQGKFKTFILFALAGLTDPEALFRGIYKKNHFYIKLKTFWGELAI